MRLPKTFLATFVTLLGALWAQTGLTIINDSLPSAIVQQNYTAQLTATGGSGSYSWTISSGKLPSGVNLNGQTGLISGTPAQVGTYPFTVRVLDNQTGQATTKGLSIVVNSQTNLAITTNSPLPSTEVGLQYSVTFAASGGTPPYIFFAQSNPFAPSGLPPGLSLAQNGVLSGSPTTGGTYTFDIFVQDSTSTKISKTFQIVVASAVTITTSSPLPSGTRGTPYSQGILVSGGVPPYTFSIANPPPGLSLDINGGFNGTPQVAGVFNFTVFVSDKMGGTFSKNFQVTIQDINTGGGGPPLPVKTSPTNLSFTVALNGTVPPPQFIDVTPVGNTPAGYTIQVDNGPNTTKPTWITVTPLGGLAPVRLQVNIDQDSMPVGTYTARVLVIDNAPTFTTVSVTLTIVDMAPQFNVAPAFLRFSARSAAPGIQDQVLTIQNNGGGAPFSFSAQILPGDASFISTVTPSSGQLSRNTSVRMDVRINSVGLAVGSYRQVIRFTTPFGTFDVPVTLFVAGNGAILSTDVTGLRFQAQAGAGYSNAQTVKVLNTGDPSTTLTWTASLVTGSDLFAFSTSGNTAAVNKPGTISIVPTAAALQKGSGGYYGLLRITSAALNSPQYVVLLLDLGPASAAPLADLSPTGFLFLVTPGAQTSAQVLTVNTTSTTQAPFEVAVTTRDGGNWLTANPASGVVSSSSPGQVTLTVLVPANEPQTILTGDVSVSESGVLRTATVTAIVLPSASTSSGMATTPAANCVGTKLALTTTGLVNNFGAPARWPESLIVQLTDDCGVPVVNGSVSASFSNGDAPLSLKGDGQLGIYSASWQPMQDTTQMVVTLQASAGALQPATLQLMGSITPNTAPVLSVNGTVNPFNRLGGDALAPGTLVEVYGSGLAPITASPNVLPLPPVFNNTFVTVGPFQAPFTFASAGQVNVQLPYELVPTQQYQILVSANNAFTMPDTLNIIPLKPEVANFSDGHTIAQHAVDFSLVDASHPAKPGEFIVIYLLGMGATNPPVATGAPSPGTPPATAAIQPLMTVGGLNTNVVFAGLTPGLAGLYQIDFQVPDTAPNGDLDLIVTQNGKASNTTKLTVLR